ncbi:hypothetical protein [Roseomonas genomospecies 6]|uniref:Uncharacterized protein n=1 Tax=Roseomonas genomospecies 6 TaxID=214106 RepID=A0A9W7KQI5_9PROT|nr:hypothetical protein [Roseomonas genomospecies 6]KAA0677635.1 hypothetical protein DS843_22615 [Roseomonas genomospecies 6]
MSQADNKTKLQGLLVDLGEALAPNTSNERKIAVLAAELRAAESTVNKWFYGVAAPRGAAFNYLCGDIQRRLTERQLGP